MNITFRSPTGRDYPIYIPVNSTTEQLKQIYASALELDVSLIKLRFNGSELEEGELPTFPHGAIIQVAYRMPRPLGTFQFTEGHRAVNPVARVHMDRVFFADRGAELLPPPGLIQRMMADNPDNPPPPPSLRRSTQAGEPLGKKRRRSKKKARKTR